MKQLPNLPDSKDEYWKLSETNQHPVDEMHCDHDFKMITGTEMRCDKCGAGLYTLEPRKEMSLVV